MKGTKLIKKERKEQIKKHKSTIKNDVEYNPNGELAIVASCIIQNNDLLYPDFWDKEFFSKMQASSYEKRLIVAGALIAAELDRLKYIEKHKK